MLGRTKEPDITQNFEDICEIYRRTKHEPTCVVQNLRANEKSAYEGAKRGRNGKPKSKKKEGAPRV